MFLRSTPYLTAALAVIVTASLVLSGCGGGGGDPKPIVGAEFVSVAIQPTEIPAAGGSVSVTIVTKGNPQAPQVAMVPEGGTPGIATTAQLQGNLNPDGTTWVASVPVTANAAGDVYLVAHVTGIDTSGHNMASIDSSKVLQYGAGATKPNITLWGDVRSSKTGEAVPLQATPTVSKQTSTGWVVVDTPRAWKDSTGRFQIPFVGTAGTTYMLTLNCGPNYYAYQKMITPRAGVNDKIEAKVTSTDEPPPPPPF